jgi:hypothetical protein
LGYGRDSAPAVATGAGQTPIGSADADKAFRRDLIKIIVDKLLITLILTVVGLFAAVIVEKSKSRENFSAEVNKMRVEKIGEVWNKIYLYEAAIEDAHASVAEMDRKIQSGELILGGPPLPTRIRPGHVSGAAAEMLRWNKEYEKEYAERQAKIFEPSRTLQADLTDTMNRSRFWLGEENYRLIKEYVADTDGYLNNLRWMDGTEKLLKATQGIVDNLDALGGSHPSAGWLEWMKTAKEYQKQTMAALEEQRRQLARQTELRGKSRGNVQRERDKLLAE